MTVDFRNGRMAPRLGPSALKNIARAPTVSLFWLPLERGGYAMILNGTASIGDGSEDDTMTEIVITKSVLPRSGPKPGDSAGPCGSGCPHLTR